MESTGPQGNPDRPHTGRRRNEATHQAILDAALRLLGESGGANITIDAIARAAGVGKQTVYRWWPSKGAVLLEALTERSLREVPMPDSGSLRDDLLAVVESTFLSTQRNPTGPALRSLVREAARDPHLAELLRTFTAQRRTAVRELLARGLKRGDLPAGADLDLMVDQFYGVFWYRFLLGHAPLDKQSAERLTDSILRAE
ncbi:TetR/AcrR family transcriptional regulator [Nocardia sp. NPDC051030]|uniref:TetR/AcrR family transcriptional regulator n=1 Tax=Nocardia sp. NPDC051030 TaxID=3155162 RepID=UPI003438F2D9